MSIKNYIEGDINDVSLIVNSNKINTYELNTEGDVKIKSYNGDIVNYKTPSAGASGTQLTIDSNGNTFWGVSGGIGGVSNPMSEDLYGNDFDIKEVRDISVQSISSLGDIVANNVIDLSNNDIKNVNSIKLNTIIPNSSLDITIDAQGTAKMLGGSKAIVESQDDVELICELGSNVRLTNNLTLEGQSIYLVSNTGTIDFANANLNNVNDIIGYVKYKIISAGSDINFNGRVRIEKQTFNTTPLLLFRRIYTNGVSVYDGSFMSYNPTQNKIWRAPALCVVDNLNIDKVIGNFGVSSIGGTTRASTIDFIINGGYLECWITANFNNPTINVFEFSIWSDTN